ncbi:MAG: mannose-1-phosphate guanylyltransferase [Pirellulaceae bacterium]|jgi:mannose-1-phosphate guanylyltransferase
MLHAVIMAGGSGTRFWPASRAAKPKQLLTMGQPKSMLQETAERLVGLVTPEHLLVLTNEQLKESVVGQLPMVPAEHIIGEPFKRDTAPCIGLAAFLIAAADPEGTMLVMPSDHVIAPKEEFHRAILAGVAMLESDPEQFVTFGIRPTYPAESFGYIQRGNAVAASDGIAAFQVDRFREKPNRETAEQFLAEGGFYWNSGIFLWKARTILRALQDFQPEMYRLLEQIAEGIGSSGFQQGFRNYYEKVTGISIDFAVLEKYPKINVIEAPFQWDDVGSWQALARLLSVDSHGNAVQGPYLPIDSKNMIVRTEPDHLVVTIGMDSCIVVHTQDATLVAPKSEEERVREVVQQLKELGHHQYL